MSGTGVEDPSVTVKVDESSDVTLKGFVDSDFHTCA